VVVYFEKMGVVKVNRQ
jgi:hypothetical protein